jgi:hypothetical protein
MPCTVRVKSPPSSSRSEWGQQGRDGRDVGRHDAEAAREAAVAQRLFQPRAVVGGEEVVYRAEVVHARPLVVRRSYGSGANIKNNGAGDGAARVENLQFAPTVDVERLKCGHKSELAVEAVAKKLPEWYRALDIYRVVRCEMCGARGTRSSMRAGRSGMSIDAR